MRYLANNLVWRGNRHTDLPWLGNDGASLEAAFAFGGQHGWQYPSAELRMFVAMPLCVQEARAWIQRAPFGSLLAALRDVSPWEALVEELLGVEVGGCRVCERLSIDGNDQVLRLGVPEKMMSHPDEQVINALRENPELARWHLHVLRPFDRMAARSAVYRQYA